MNGRGWDRNNRKRDRLAPTAADSSCDLQGEQAGGEDGEDRPRSTRSDAALGQPVDGEPARIDDDPRSQRGSSRTTATPPEGAGVEPSG
jgi:hypothetical protein